MKNITLAIIEVMKEVDGVAKSMTVWSGSNSYKWVSDKDVKELIRESMIKNWLAILPTGVTPKIQIDRWEEVDSYSKTGAMKTKQSIFTEVETKYILIHTSGETIELAGYGQWVDTQDKGAGKATTYALKNTLLNMFLVPTGGDTDNTHSDEYDVPKKAETKTYKTPVWQKEFMEYIEEIKKENDTNHLQTLVNEACALYKSEKQVAWIKKEAWYRRDYLIDHQETVWYEWDM